MNKFQNVIWIMGNNFFFQKSQICLDRVISKTQI